MCPVAIRMSGKANHKALTWRELPVPSQPDLAQYAATYQSDELQAKHKIAVKDGKLTLALNWQEPFALAPSERDEFQAAATGASFVFQRDARGHVAAVDVFARRVRNIGFTRSAN